MAEKVYEMTVDGIPSEAGDGWTRYKPLMQFFPIDHDKLQGSRPGIQLKDHDGPFIEKAENFLRGT